MIVQDWSDRQAFAHNVQCSNKDHCFHYVKVISGAQINNESKQNKTNNNMEIKY